jgi:hypothetical protein
MGYDIMVGISVTSVIDMSDDNLILLLVLKKNDILCMTIVRQTTSLSHHIAPHSTIKD